MKSPLYLSLALALAAASCKPEQPAPPTTPPTTSTQPQAATGTTSSATSIATASSTSEFAAKKADFLHVMRAQMDEVNTEINAMESQVINSFKQDKEVVQPKIDVLRAQAQNIKVQLNHVDDISEAGWSNFSTGVDKAYADLKNAITDNRQWMSNYLISHKAF